MTTRNKSYPSDVSERLLTHARIPPLYWKAELPANSSAAAYAKSLRGNLKEGRGLLLLGQHGAGKTHQACALAICALAITPRVLFMTAADLIDTYRPKERVPMFDPDYGVTLVQAFRNRDLLVIDDLGTEYKGSESGFAEQTLINLIRYRTGAKKATVLTSNYSPEQIGTIYGDGFRSLLAESCLPILIKGEDHRRNPARRERMARDYGIRK